MIAGVAGIESHPPMAFPPSAQLPVCGMTINQKVDMGGTQPANAHL